MEQLEQELKKLNLRVGNVELKNNDQDDAIMFLKTRRDATFSIINQTEEPRHHQSYYESNNKTADYFDDAVMAVVARGKCAKRDHLGFYLSHNPICKLHIYGYYKIYRRNISISKVNNNYMHKLS